MKISTESMNGICRLGWLVTQPKPDPTYNFVGWSIRRSTHVIFYNKNKKILF